MNKRVKKAIILCLAIFVAISLVACGPKRPPAARTAAPEQTDTTVAKPEGYPSKTISWIVPVAPGSATDLVTRALADRLDLGVNISVEDIPGGSQTVGVNEAKSRPADGYTLLSFANAGLISQPLINPDIGYTLDDFRLLAMEAPPVMATITVSKESKIKTPEDFIDFVTSGEPFTYSVPSLGGYGYVTMLSVLDQIGSTTGEGVGYGGNNGAYQALLTGEVAFAVVDDNFIFNYYNQGECNVICCIATSSSAYLPDVPPMSNYNIKDLDALTGWKVLAVRVETPDDIVEWIKQQVNEVLGSDEYSEYLKAHGYGAFEKLMTEEELTDVVKKAYSLYEDTLTKNGLM